MESLQGNFLIATPQMPDPRFRQQVVYLCGHNAAEGAMGLVINQLSGHNLDEVMAGLGIAPPVSSLPPIHLGGPVETEAGFFLFSADFDCPHYLEVTSRIRLSSDVAILRDIARGVAPADYLFALGYSGWAPGQLESELAEDTWLVLPGDYEVIFHTPVDRKWKEAARLGGIDIAIFGGVVGSA
ncbi:MAG: YqgE/AlgH family protein [Desulfobulbaceae bacterium]|nr:YqgE/AlgH family protein [Desulfobulbaceae bacterium]